MNNTTRYLRNLFVGLADVCLCTLAHPIAYAAPPQKIAVVIGVADYFNKNMEDLAFAEKDARDVSDQLRQIGFKVATIVGNDAGQANVQAKLDAVLDRAGKLEPDSVLLIMFSGHGQQLQVTEKTGDQSRLIEVPFFCPRDAIPFDSVQHSLRGKSAEDIETEFKLVSLNRLIGDIDRKSNSLQNLLIVDACRNNPAKGKAAGITGAIAREMPRGISILFGARSGQKSWESSDPEIKQGVFTHYLLQGLRGAARNDRSEITWSRLVSYVSEEVEYEGWKLAGGPDHRQNPHAIINNDRTILLDGYGDIDPLSTGAALASIAKMDVRPGDWPMWGGWPGRNNVPNGKNIPSHWDIKTGENIKWVADVGSTAYVPPVIANGRVFIGTNNQHGHLTRFPQEQDLGVLLCFDEQTGKLQWQYSAKKLLTGRVHDWPLQGIVSAPYADGDRLWFVDNRANVVCLDAKGFQDGENDGPFKSEDVVATDEADVIWRYDMMTELGTSQLNKATCSPVCYGDRLFIITGNGVDESQMNMPSPNAPAIICLDRNTGKILWSDNSANATILQGQWSSPAIMEQDDDVQVLFPVGHGWLYSFTVDGKFLWKFDGNSKDAVWQVYPQGTRNNFIALPTVFDGRVYIATGDSPESGEGEGHLWCIDPSKRGDVSAQLVLDRNQRPVTQQGRLYVNKAIGEHVVDNPNSAVIWHFSSQDDNHNGEIEFEEQYNRMIGAMTIQRDLLFTTDFSGLTHCFDAINGTRLAYYDNLAQSWSSPLMVDGKVFQCDEDGDVAVFDFENLAANQHNFKRVVQVEPLRENNMGNPIYASPVIANNVLYVATEDRLYAIEQGTKTAPEISDPMFNRTRGK